MAKRKKLETLQDWKTADFATVVRADLAAARAMISMVLEDKDLFELVVLRIEEKRDRFIKEEQFLKNQGAKGAQFMKDNQAQA